MDDVFNLEGFFFQTGEDTITRLEGRISVPMTTRMSVDEIRKKLKGEDGILARIEQSLSKRMGSGVQVWSDGASIREDGIIFKFRLTIMDFNGFDMLRDEIRAAFKGVTA
jgi:hypothetical protein